MLLHEMLHLRVSPVVPCSHNQAILTAAAATPMLSMLLMMEDTLRTTTTITTPVRSLGTRGQTAMPQQPAGTRSSQASPEQGTTILCRWGGVAQGRLHSLVHCQLLPVIAAI